MKPHKWHKEIKAWANGAEIEARFKDYYGNYVIWFKAASPQWDDCVYEHRIKPQPKEPQYLYVYEELGGEVMIETKPSAYCGDCIGKIKLETDNE